MNISSDFGSFFVYQFSDDEVTVSECELQDLSIAPLLNALYAHKTFAMLDLSHNLLGNFLLTFSSVASGLESVLAFLFDMLLLD